MLFSGVASIAVFTGVLVGYLSTDARNARKQKSRDEPPPAGDTVDLAAIERRLAAIEQALTSDTPARPPRDRRMPPLDSAPSLGPKPRHDRQAETPDPDLRGKPDWSTARSTESDRRGATMNTALDLDERSTEPGLTPQESRILDFERTWWRFGGRRKKPSATSSI